MINDQFICIYPYRKQLKCRVGIQLSQQQLLPSKISDQTKINPNEQIMP